MKGMLDFTAQIVPSCIVFSAHLPQKASYCFLFSPRSLAYYPWFYMCQYLPLLVHVIESQYNVETTLLTMQ